MIRTSSICTALAGVGFVGAASAQHAPGYAAPKTTWGVPDIQGFWNSTSITSLQRPRGVDKLVVTEKKGARLSRTIR